MIYNEIAYGKKVKETGFIGKSIKYDLLILSKYLKHIDNLKKKDHVEFVYDFCYKYMTDFNEVLHGSMVDNTITNGRKLKNKPVNIESIVVYKREMEFINGLELTDNEKKILLTMLASKKISYERGKQTHSNIADMSVHFSANTKKYNSLIKMAKIEGKINIHSVINKFVGLGLVEATCNGQLVFKCYEQMFGGEVLYDVKPIDFPNIGLYFDLYNDNKVKRCEECGRLIRITTSNNKYCQPCAKIVKTKMTILARKQ